MRLARSIQAALLFPILLGSSFAAEEPHWAFQPIAKPVPPEVRATEWIAQPLDNFVLAPIEDRGDPAPPLADRLTLLRRATFDLIGLPPTPEEVEAFRADKKPGAYARVIDRLLSSPHYGERWGRHWLDLARYGDSNGGDENHAYPHAWRYRNWVINALNRDLPYDQFVREQLAGDLMNPGGPDQLTATGFLAIGTKILAEKDPVKKQADIVDEQIDTVGRVFLGLSLGCARCHDHKFDPVPERDYYALAGIFHSTAIENRELVTPKALAVRKKLAEEIKELDARIASAETKLKDYINHEASIAFEAEAHARGNVVIDRERYGKDIGIISDPGGQKNYAEYDLNIKEEGLYFLQLRYAAKNARPGQVLLDGKVVVQDAIAKTTGGWQPENQQWHDEGSFEMASGKRVLRLQSEPMMSHLDKVRLLPVTAPAKAAKVRDQLTALRDERTKLNKRLQADKPKAMAVKDGKVADARINVRGNPNDLGEVIPRGFLTAIGAEGGAPKLDKQSGRLELARWMTRPSHPLTARVMVNRVWQWHFGEGLVDSPDNFGTTGAEPSNRALLDFLTRQFIAEGWSLKSLHRRIMLSSTYRTEAGQGLRKVRRVEAEVFRDSVLAVSGALDLSPHEGPPPTVKAQDPSPADLARNRKTYEEFPHRSVYLPVVRCHIYDLLTLLNFPNSTAPVGKRDNTTVATQALLMLNNPFLMDQAAKVATSVRQSEDPLNELHLRLFTKPIGKEERAWANEFLEASDDDESAWNTLCHTLLISNNFLYVR